MVNKEVGKNETGFEDKKREMDVYEITDRLMEIFAEIDASEFSGIEKAKAFVKRVNAFKNNIENWYEHFGSVVRRKDTVVIYSDVPDVFFFSDGKNTGNCVAVGMQGYTEAMDKYLRRLGFRDL